MINFYKFCSDNNVPLTTMSNFDIMAVAKRLKIPHFRGCFMRDTLPKKMHPKECGVVNLQSNAEQGSHWCCYYRDKSERYYFDSYGLDMVNELKSYLKGKNNPPIVCSTYDIQAFGTPICGALCIYVLCMLGAGSKFVDIILSLVDERL